MNPTLTELNYFRQKKTPTLGSLDPKEITITVHDCINSRSNQFKPTCEANNTWTLIRSYRRKYSGEMFLSKLIALRHTSTPHRWKKRLSIVENVLDRLNVDRGDYRRLYLLSNKTNH